MRRGAIVLCGGRSRRMGRDKAWLDFGGEALLTRVVRRVAEAVEEVIVVSRPDQRLPELSPGTRVVHDVVLDLGPLGGLVPGLEATQAEAVFVTACDVPFLRASVVDLLFERLGTNDVAVCEALGRLQPLAAVYRRSVLPHVTALLVRDRRRPIDLYDDVATVRVTEAEMREVDPELDTLANVNTVEAYEEALARDRTGDLL